MTHPLMMSHARMIGSARAAGLALPPRCSTVMPEKQDRTAR
jgi:hypothetical protein